MKKSFIFAIILWFAAILVTEGCVSPRVKLFNQAPEPFHEEVLSGTGPGKILMIPISGIISDHPHKGLVSTKPGMVQDIVSQLDLAARDKDIKAVLLKINSPGGTVTASDIIYHEIMEFKKKTGDKVVAVMMNVAASGGYYIALSADHIIAHPSTVTGSVGVIFMRPQISGLMNKIGVDVAVSKSGKNKDMGSPFRPGTKEEDKLFQDLTDKLGKRFVSLVKKRRHLNAKQLAEIKTARIFLAFDAKNYGLIDTIGYMDDAVKQCVRLAGLPETAEVVVYRRTTWPDDNLYNSQQMINGALPSLIDPGLPGYMTRPVSGFCYLWTPGIETP